MITTRRLRRSPGEAEATADTVVAPLPVLPSMTRPRPVRLSGTGWFVAIIAALLTASSIAAGGVLLAAATRGRDFRRQLDTEGVTARSVVVGKTRTRGDDPRYVVEYTYTAAGRAWPGRRTIRRSHWNQLAVGSELDVRYLPGRPEESWVVGYEPDGVPIVLGPLVAFGLAFLAWVAWHELRKQWVLLAEGRPVMGQVTTSKKVAGQHGKRYEVSYEYRLLSGAARTGKFYVEKAPPSAGTPLGFMYDLDNPDRSARYPFSLVRIA